MSRGSGTRSGMLWEVERILKEIVADGGELPQILLMENVPDVCGTKNIRDFNEWLQFLESIGYTNKYTILNAKDFSIPQNRERCFCVSWLGDYYYNFPDQTGLEYSLIHFLDEEVDDKYYLSDKMIEKYLAFNKEREEKGQGFRFEPSSGGGGYSKTILTRPGQRPCDNYLSVKSRIRRCEPDNKGTISEHKPSKLSEDGRSGGNGSDKEDYP